jgi:hypothetical protein
MDAPRKSDGQHAPETPKPNARRPASIFHFNSIWAALALRPNRRCNATTPQTSAVQHTAGIEKKTHAGGKFRRHKSSGLAFIKWSLRQTVCQERRPMSRNARAVH